MKRSKFTESQIIKAIKENEAGRSVDEISRELGINPGTFYNWRKEILWDGSFTTEGDEGVANREFEVKENVCGVSFTEYNAKRRFGKKVVKPSVKRSIANYLKSSYQGSIRTVCRTLSLQTSTYYRKSTKDDSEVELKLQTLAKRYPTRGVDWYYGKIRQEGLLWNRKRVLRVYRKLNLGLRRKHRKRINRPYKEGLSQPIAPNVSWSMDFMSDALEDKRRIRIFNIIDDYNREALAIRVGISFPSDRVIRVLEELKETKGLPAQIRVDNGPEFISYKLKDYCKINSIHLAYIQPGKPNQNGYIERFNRTYREDVLDAYIFEQLSQVQILSNKWKEEYNHGHPHQSLKRMSPVAFKHHRHKVIDAYDLVKAKMNGSKEPALTKSTSSMIGCLRDIKMDF